MTAICILCFFTAPVTQPFVHISDSTVTGGTSVIFTCISPDTDVSIRWIFNEKNLQLTERMTLSPTKCGLKIDPVRSEDAGEYKCEVSNQVSSKTSLPVSWGHHKWVTTALIPHQSIDISLSMGYKMETHYVLKMISYYSDTASMVTHTYNTGRHMGIREDQEWKWCCLKRKIKTSIW